MHRRWGIVLVVLAVATVGVTAYSTARQQTKIDCQMIYSRNFAATFEHRIGLVDDDREAEENLSRARLEHGITSPQAQTALTQFIWTTANSNRERSANPYPEYQC